jgi:hypothetical protein
MDLFTLTITVGNDAMQTRRDIAKALRAVAERLASPYGETTDDGAIFDLNGNKVGRWAIDQNSFEIVRKRGG